MKDQGKLTGCLNRKSSPSVLPLALVPSKGRVKVKVKLTLFPSTPSNTLNCFVVVCVAFGISILVLASHRVF